MLSVACQEPATPPADSVAEPPRSATSRRIAVSFAAGNRTAPGARRPQRDQVPTVPLPRYSRIIFRAGNATVR